MAFLRFISYACLLILALVGFRIIASRMKYVYKFLLNTAIGLIGIYIFNAAGRYAGVTVGINLFSGVIVGLCGPFGIVILLIMRLMTF